jgi:heterodisulfide reductase subunit C
VDLAFRDEIRELSGQDLDACYHCHKCTAGCPMAGSMQYGPAWIIRQVALGEASEALGSRDIWLCSGCYTCATRCPNDIDVSAVIDALRQVALRRRVSAAERDALLFHRLFLGVVEQLGKSHEALMLGLFKVLSHTPIYQDMGAGAGLFLRGKVPLLPERPAGVSEVKQIFRRSL